MTLLDTLLGRRSSIPDDRALVPVEPEVLQAKAVTGMGAVALTYSPPLWSLDRTPQKMAYQAAMLFHDHDTIHKAETAISDRAGKVKWHLEVGEDEVTDTSPPAWKAARDLLERPQQALPLAQRQPGMNTRRGMWTKTMRHTGLCGYAAWFLDQTDALAGIPLAILYIAPWRLYTVTNAQDGLLGWSLDKPLEEGGLPVRLEDLLMFYLSPPDRGYFASGLVQAAATKIPLGPLTDRHVQKVLASGGRLAGLLSPKVGSVVTEDNWTGFVRDYRNITQDPDAALRLQIVQGAVDFVKTAATMDELALMANDERVNDAIMELWGVPGSQTGKEQPAGLNSGSTKDKDEAVLWQGAIDTRLSAFYETVQYGLLDRWKTAGVSVELVLEPPQFDDDSPQYAKAVQAVNLPLTNDERRALVNLDPLEDTALGAEVWIAGTLTRMLSAAAEPPPPAMPPSTAFPFPRVDVGPLPPLAKATLTRFEKLRRQVDKTHVSQVKRNVQKVLDEQRESVVRYLRTVGLDHLKRKHDIGAPGLDPKLADRKLETALHPTLSKIVRKVAISTRAELKPGKADVDDFTERVVTRVLTRGAGRVRGINQTTRDAVQLAIAESLEGAETIQQVIAAVEDLTVFGELRAETIARTESMFAYNDAALGSYQEMGVEMVEAIDGDEDEECAARDGQVFTVEEASAITDHPNGTLDWAPVIPDEEPPQKATRTEIEYNALRQVVAFTERAI